MKKRPLTKSQKELSAASKAAKKILADQKKEYPRLLSKYQKKYGFKEGTKMAVSEYKRRYGKDASTRWQKAIETAKK